MDLAAVAAQLADLPPAFRPQGGWYAQMAASLALALSLFTAGADATCQQALGLPFAVDGWTDAWGLLFGVARNPSEGNAPYAARIASTVLAQVGTLPALQAWTGLFAPGGSVTEMSPGPGYVIALPVSMTAAQVAQFVSSLGRIRPVGVPFAVSRAGTGLYLGTEAFLGAGQFLGSYLTATPADAALSLSATTPSAQPLAPALFLSDPYLARPGLLGQALQGQWPPSSDAVRISFPAPTLPAVQGLETDTGLAVTDEYGNPVQLV